MGVVYSKEVLQQERVPTREQLTSTAQNIMGVLNGMHDQGLIEHAMVHGSVPEGRHNERSDLDVYIVHASISAARSNLNTLHAVSSAEAAVTLEPVTVTAGFTSTTTNSMMYDPLFIYHLKEDFEHVDSDWIVGGPDSRITNRPPLKLKREEVGRIMSAYVAYKLNGFIKLVPNEQYADAETQRAGLQRVLEYPKSMYRKLQQAESIEIGRSMDAEELTSVDSLGFTDYLGRMASIGMITPVNADMILGISGADNEYSEILRAHATGQATAQEVNNYLEVIYPEVTLQAARSAESMMLSFEDYFRSLRVHTK